MRWTRRDLGIKSILGIPGRKMVSSSSRSIPGVRDLWEEGWDSAGTLLGEAGASRGRGVVAPSAGSVSRLLLPSLRPIPVVAVNRDYLYKYIPEVSKVPRILFSSELLALPRTPRAGDLHLPRASVQTSPARPTAGTGRGREFRGNSRGPRAENGTTRSLFLPLFPFSPGWSSPRVSLALASGSRSRSWIFPLVPCLCLCLSCPTRERRRLGGVWVERPSFMDIFLDLMFSKPFLYPTPSPGTGSAPGGRGLGDIHDIHDIRDLPPVSRALGGLYRGNLLRGIPTNPSVGSSPVHSDTGECSRFVAVPLEIPEWRLQGFPSLPGVCWARGQWERSAL
ncbi:uncharacterized protein LOC113960343 [Corapipo altera]|uniref:uncharacterized protein LOC113960343 n=1 Tax=Corapipo altera TaxID=415028 RepID=UPI000FD67264|nr:uncharacterized protein LOC113960343 [Corapipo altera]